MHAMNPSSMFKDWSAKEIGLLLAFLVNFAAVVWGASSLSTSFENLSVTMKSFDVRLSRVEDSQIDIRVRLAVQEALKGTNLEATENRP